MLKTDKHEVKASTSLFVELEETAHEVIAKTHSSRMAGITGTDVYFSSTQSCFWQKEHLDAKVRQLASLSSDQYRDIVINPVDNPDRWAAPRVIKALCDKLFDERKHGPLYLTQGEIATVHGSRKVAFMGQNRKVDNGVWGPEHHRMAADWVREMERWGRPIVTFMDTPGADASEAANLDNQAHAISQLIAVIADVTVPVISIVLGMGYSGGAIPLASGNVLLSVRDALFSTIQPKGLAAIARKQRLSWFACAQHVGVSAAELCHNGIIDAVIDYSPEDGAENMANLLDAIHEGISWSVSAGQSMIARLDYGGASYLESGLHFCRDNLPPLLLHEYLPEQYPSLIDYGLKLQRAISYRGRLKTGRLDDLGLSDVADAEIAQDQYDENEAVKQILAERFDQWVSTKERIIYEDLLLKAWKRYLESVEHRGEKRSYVAALFLGDPEDEYERAFRELCFEVSFYLYNRWQQDAVHHLEKLIRFLKSDDNTYAADQFAEDQLTLLDIIRDKRFSGFVVTCCERLIQLDRLYEVILDGMTQIVTELAENNKLSADLMGSLLARAGLEGDEGEQFLSWLGQVRESNQLGRYMQVAEHWKRTQHPRMAEVLFVVVSYFFDRLFPDYYQSIKHKKSFSGQFTPVSIGRRKDFWNRLVGAEKDLRIQALLNEKKPASLFTPNALIERFFSGFREFDADLTTADPCHFPGFAQALLRQKANGDCASGVLTGVARYSPGGGVDENAWSREVGLVVSNHTFQAGAFDMASAERFCRLLTHCAKNRLPVICFICSGGMQTKEGAGALFSMAVVNEQINRFVSEVRLPVLVFGYGDCTGGAQASFVTHPLVQTWYFSGTNMPFAGRIVVPNFLPVTATLSNYLVAREGSMQGLVKHPFVEDLDERLSEIDEEIIVATRSVDEVISHWLNSRLPLSPEGKTVVQSPKVEPIFGPIEKVLVHARGCTAVKLVDQIQKAGLKVCLVQSDPDMTSVAADMLRPRKGDQLVCLGGFTSDESYLNGESVLHIAKLQKVQALHPGIGFLSENAEFAQQCLNNGINFIGPSPAAMAMMGDKSQAIRTAMSLDVPVVPGSHGVLRDESHALEIAREIGFPVILKAAHGGGGKGIVVVEDEKSLVSKFLTIKAEARSSFGNDDIYLERFVTRFRHIEVQLLRDRFGHCFALGLRDCSVQRNKQKIIEESASTLLPADQAELARQSAIKLANACDYVGAGTVEFIFDLDKQALYFMEMNTRLQVEHPVTELVTGVNIVQQQLKIAQGESLKGLTFEEHGYALEVRVNAERVSVSKGEITVEPTPGHVEKCLFPKMKSVTEIVTIVDGKSVPPFYDNLVAQLIAYGKDREDAIRKMLDYLQKIRVEGISTNIGLLTFILQDDVFRSGEYDTGYLIDLAEREQERLEQHLGETGVARDTGWQSGIAVEGSDELKVFAPSNAILYRSPAPNKPNFVEEGAIIDANDPLCLLEVMKVFQPLTLASFNTSGNVLYPEDQRYEVVLVKGTDGQQVNAGELLFVVRPVGENQMS